MGFRVLCEGLIFSLILNGLMSSPALGACRTDAPQARAFALGHGSCPSGYYRSGGACAPSGGPRVLLFRPLKAVVPWDTIVPVQHASLPRTGAATPLHKWVDPALPVTIDPVLPAFRTEAFKILRSYLWGSGWIRSATKTPRIGSLVNSGGRTSSRAS